MASEPDQSRDRRQHRTGKGFARGHPNSDRAWRARQHGTDAARECDAAVHRLFSADPRGELGQVFGKETWRDTIGHLRKLGFIAAGPSSPRPGAPYTHVTTPTFLSRFGFETLRDTGF